MTSGGLMLTALGTGYYPPTEVERGELCMDVLCSEEPKSFT